MDNYVDKTVDKTVEIWGQLADVLGTISGRARILPKERSTSPARLHSAGGRPDPGCPPRATLVHSVHRPYDYY